MTLPRPRHFQQTFPLINLSISELISIVKVTPVLKTSERPIAILQMNVSWSFSMNTHPHSFIPQFGFQFIPSGGVIVHGGGWKGKSRNGKRTLIKCDNSEATSNLLLKEQRLDIAKCLQSTNSPLASNPTLLVSTKREGRPDLQM